MPNPSTAWILYMAEQYNVLNEWGNELSVSVACRITENGDEPVRIDGVVPFFSHYRDAERFLEGRGYSFDRDSGRELGIVYESSLQAARLRFGEVVPYRN